tara:strand:+ start:572 stop:871 length:300 start_codon:yes stop_codon:yes gene_type:complete
MTDMKKWDYFVIHVNFEDNKNTEIQNSKKASEKLGGSLSKEFLEKEFPEQFKSLKPGLHPSKQLQIILNKIGDEGWKLETTERIGNLLMFIFMKEKITT